ncbi:MAG: DUF2147 domain-containing protein [Pseudomonadota bacterium]
MRILFLAAALMLPTAAFGQEVAGLWKSEPNDEGNYIHVEVGACPTAGLTCGVIVGAFDGNDQPANPDVVGRTIVADMEADGATEWSGGTIWAPDEDRTYSSRMELSGDVLTVKGCVLGGLICRGQDWTRLE